MIELTIPTADGMERLGARFAALLRAGDLLVLDGPLGAGKTTFTLGLGAALGARGPITSPTFVLAREHPTAGGTPLIHVDAYRLESGREVDDLDLDFDRAIVVVEWGAGKLDGVADSWVEVRIDRPAGAGADAEGAGDDVDEPRRVRITGVGTRWAGLDDDLRDAGRPQHL
jgi:tRNA threonylcarbamoyladenosine biosynthesis protein TsaE